uniref:Calponin-homology (CH) domain-containing protein n=1 Tax=Heterorhabditis bacteriophora TaxID=37862 RepID=A0A1I7XQ86_HETBA
MTKSLRTLTEWLDSLGYSSHAWLSGDWHQPLHLLSKLLAEDLKERRPTNSKNDVAFKISFDARDLMIQYPNIYLALLFYLVCLKHSLGYVDPHRYRINCVASSVPSRLIRPTTAPPPAPSIQEHCSQIKPVIMRDNLVSPKLHISSKPNSILSNVQQKPLPPPKPKGITVDKSRGTVLMDKNDSCDPTTSIIQKMTEATDAIIEIGPSPIAPPRPKRASLLLSGGVTSQLSPLKNTSMSRCSSLSSGEMHHIPRLHGIVTVSKIHDKSSQSIKNVIDKYPEDMCPFDQDDEVQIFLVIVLIAKFV